MINSGFIIIWYENRCWSSGGAACSAFASHVQRSAWRWSRITRVHLQSIDLPGPRGWGPVATFRVLLILEPYVFSSSHVLIWRSCRAANRVASGILFCAVGSGASRTAVSGLDWTVNSCALRATISCCMLSVVTRSPLCCLCLCLFTLPILCSSDSSSASDRSVHLFSKAIDPHELNVVCYCYRLLKLSSKL